MKNIATALDKKDAFSQNSVFLDQNYFSGADFNAKYRYDGKDLGVCCTNGRTVFKLWSPFAERVLLCLYPDGDKTAFLQKEMQKRDKGVWELAFDKSLHGVYYDYLLQMSGRMIRTADPYAIGCSCNGERSMAVDLTLTNPPGFALDAAPPAGREQIIYEMHIKDFSYDEESGVPKEYRGKYKAFTIAETNGAYPTCMKYLKELGITHVQLMPFFDYGSVDEAGEEPQYNWGYDPMNYNVPEGSYATNASDGTVRILECKEMIQALHQNGLRVIMDVVYNHTYREDSWLQRTVPGYYYRYTKEGALANGSACGNDIAAGRAMVDNYIANSVMYWAKEYHVDGFRFDLMGLLTVELMNRIQQELDEEFGAGEKILYGEPWRADISPMEAGTKAALKINAGFLKDGIGIFSDDVRDAIKGSVFREKEPGFINGGRGFEASILHAVTGFQDGGAAFVPKSCAQIINYVSAHDNFTLWDKLLLSMRDAGSDYNTPYPEILAANKLAAFIYFTCQGRIFLQAGEEFGRTKLGEDNSYRSCAELNMLAWHRTLEFQELVDYYKGLIRLRKRLPAFYDKSPSAVRRISKKKVCRHGVVSFFADNRGSNEQVWDELFIIYNASSKDYAPVLPEGNWDILVDSDRADCLRKAEKNTIRVTAHSGMLLGRKAGIK